MPWQQWHCSPSKATERCAVGGVALNHLSWAALGGGKTIALYVVVNDIPNICTVVAGLLALQGTDEFGLLIRASLRELGVWTDFIQGRNR